MKTISIEKAIEILEEFFDTSSNLDYEFYVPTYQMSYLEMLEYLSSFFQTYDIDGYKLCNKKNPYEKKEDVSYFKLIQK